MEANFGKVEVQVKAEETHDHKVIIPSQDSFDSFGEPVDEEKTLTTPAQNELVTSTIKPMTDTKSITSVNLLDGGENLEEYKEPD